MTDSITQLEIVGNVYAAIMTVLVLAMIVLLGLMWKNEREADRLFRERQRP